MKKGAVRWVLAVALSQVILAWGGLRPGDQLLGGALAVEPVQGPTRGLTPDEIRALQEGQAMGLGRAAEFNGYPDPARVLEAARAGKLDLYADQRGAIERVQAAAKDKARLLGQEILAREAALEGDFRAGLIKEAELARQVEDIARKLGELRLTHLRAHLLTAALLRPEQIEDYYQFRGYVAPSSGHVLGY